MPKELKLFAGNANPGLAREICEYLGIRPGEATISSFSDGELRVKIEENVRGADVFLNGKRVSVKQGCLTYPCSRIRQRVACQPALRCSATSTSPNRVR